MATIDKNADGSCVVKLATPVKVDGDKISRVTIPRITGKHLFKMPIFATGGVIAMGAVIEWASHVVQPKGAVEEMDPADAFAIGAVLCEALGKSQPTGEPESP